MCKLFTAKPGRTTGLFLLLGIVALQWSFTTAGTGESRAAYLLTDTSTTPVAGKTVAARNKPASTRSNRTTSSSKPVLASNLERETLSFGSPTGGPETEVGTPARKSTDVRTGAANTRTVKTSDAVNANTGKANNAVNSNTTGIKKEGASAVADKKTVESRNTNTGNAKTTKAVDVVNSNTKNEGATTTKPAVADKKTVEGRSTNTANAKTTKAVDAVNTNTKNEGASTTKSAVADKKTVESGNTNTANAKTTKATDAVNTNTANTKKAGTTNTKITPNKKAVDGPANNDSKLASFASSKNDDSKAAFADNKTVDGAGAVLNIKEENTGTVSNKTRAITAGNKTATPKTTTGSKTIAAKTTGTKTAAPAAASIGILSNKLTVYDSLHLKQAGLSKNVFALALKGMSKLIGARHIKDNLLAIVDYSQPSNKKRLYVIDLNNYQLLYNTFVAHGMNTGKKIAQSFSNKPSSNKSSLGFYITGPAYNGTNGYSLKLTGVEKGINDHALDRGIVIHGADYVCEGLIESQGFIGRSWGCPAVAQEVSQELIDLLKDGSCLFIYHPSPAYKAKSAMLR